MGDFRINGVEAAAREFEILKNAMSQKHCEVPDGEEITKPDIMACFDKDQNGIVHDGLGRLPSLSSLNQTQPVGSTVPQILARHGITVENEDALKGQRFNALFRAAYGFTKQDVDDAMRDLRELQNKYPLLVPELPQKPYETSFKGRLENLKYFSQIPNAENYSQLLELGMAAGISEGDIKNLVANIVLEIFSNEVRLPLNTEVLQRKFGQFKEFVATVGRDSFFNFAWQNVPTLARQSATSDLGQRLNALPGNETRTALLEEIARWFEGN